jgi:hypothetical protein
MTYIAYHFHWSMDEIMNMEHSQRHQWIQQVAALNQRINRQLQGT